MILNDIIQDYKFIHSKLTECADYFDKCQTIFDCYLQNTSAAASKYFSSNTSNPRETFVSEMSTIMSKCFSLITKLNSSAYKFYACLGVITSQKYSMPFLQEEILKLEIAAQTTIESTNKIIEEQLDGMKKNNLLHPFINSLQELLHIYKSINDYYNLLSNVDNYLFEPLPMDIDETELSTLELRSYKSSNSLASYVQDLSYISSFMTQLERIFVTETATRSVYLRKFESGSLRIVWAGKTIELDGIPEIIKAITESIRTFRLTSIKKKEKEEEIRAKKLENDAKELAIINSQISTISNTLGLSKDKPEDVEKIQHLCLPLVRYINNNPVGQVGDYKYDITSEVKLLEDFYFKE